MQKTKILRFWTSKVVYHLLTELWESAIPLISYKNVAETYKKGCVEEIQKFISGKIHTLLFREIKILTKTQISQFWKYFNKNFKYSDYKL
jgi:hypothetical protein